MAAAWCGPTTMMLAREVGAPNNAIRRFSMHLVVAAKAHHSSGTFHSRHIPHWSDHRKESIIFNGIEKQSRAARWDAKDTHESGQHGPSFSKPP
jgi:hypothetical protein